MFTIANRIPAGGSIKLGFATPIFTNLENAAVKLTNLVDIDTLNPITHTVVANTWELHITSFQEIVAGIQVTVDGVRPTIDDTATGSPTISCTTYQDAAATNIIDTNTWGFTVTEIHYK